MLDATDAAAIIFVCRNGVQRVLFTIFIEIQGDGHGVVGR